MANPTGVAGAHGNQQFGIGLFVPAGTPQGPQSFFNSIWFPWASNCDDSSSWQFKFVFNLALASTLLFPAEQNRVPLPGDDAAVWQWKAPPSNTLRLLTEGGQPFSKQDWRYDYDVGANDAWQWPPKPLNLALDSVLLFPPEQDRAPNPGDDASVWQWRVTRNTALLTVQAAPVVPGPTWDFNYDSASFWQGQPVDSAVLQLLTVGGQPPTPRYQFNYDYSSVWTWQGPPSDTLRILTAQKPIVPLQWGTFNYDDASVWQWSALLERNLNISLVHAPLLPYFWKFGQDDASLWTGTPLKSAVLSPLLTAGGQPPTPRYQFNYDYASVWTWAAPPSDTLRILTQQTPIVPPQWGTFAYDDAAPWVSFWEIERNLAVLFAPAQNPFAPYFWEFGLDDAAVWTGEPVRSAVLSPLLTAGGQPFSKEWRYDYDDPGPWQAWPVDVQRYREAQLPPVVRWRYEYDDASSWSWAPGRRSAVLAPLLTAGGQPPTPPPRCQFTYDDASLWTWASPHSAELAPLLTSGGQPPTKQWHYDFNDAAFWQGQPVDSAVLSQLLTVGGQVPTKFWRYDYDEAASWQASVELNLILEQTPAQVIPPPHSWAQNYLSISYDTNWQFEPYPSQIGSATPPVITKVEWIIRYRRRGRR